MKTTELFDRFIFPALNWMQLDCLRGPCTHVSAIVRDMTGYWVHPATWEIQGFLLIGLAGLLVIRRRCRTGV
jgi:hypothetical protein